MNLKSGYKRAASPAVKRYCQFLKLNKETLEQYKFWHSSKNIWKEIPQGIRRAGILDMEIYVMDDLAFMLVETPLDFDWDEAFGRLATYERQAEWEEFVSKFQMVEKGQSSEQKWTLVDRIFSLTESLL
ncbi:L-rhamnose mutarotase [Viscerimonas tarda]